MLASKQGMAMLWQWRNEPTGYLVFAQVVQVFLVFLSLGCGLGAVLIAHQQ